ncbi:hypothetical protein [Lentilactobacillus kosonis]|uniref:Uncharacterized protein n=1 Tax=Lentilactobacillus kosonis TaxID=2810561 RepID=A0A401FKK1_9LACO|nr:hypothetical protein [Lentilactobacillus kosonis]GAY72919.1 hypothetical protein NBRC111893_1065 [Lentilactobacillus kosonis]
MQNTQSYLTEITNNVKHNYQKLLNVLPTHSSLAQMPYRQLHYFADQAIDKTFPVTLTFNNDDTPVTGLLHHLKDERYLIKEQATNLTKLFFLNELTAIQKCN